MNSSKITFFLSFPYIDDACRWLGTNGNGGGGVLGVVRVEGFRADNLHANASVPTAIKTQSGAADQADYWHFNVCETDGRTDGRSIFENWG
jgi:hypothetical protein